MSRWMLSRVTDYWDEQVRAIDRGGAELLALGEADRARAVAEISDAVSEHLRVLPDEMLVRAAVPVLDDLYKAACSTERWDVGLEAYLEASAGTFTAGLTARGVRCQYLIDNAWSDLTKPLLLFPSWYAAAGLVFACPQLCAFELARADDPSITQTQLPGLLPRYDREARDVAASLVSACQEQGRHFTQLDTDLEEGSFALALEHAGADGVLTLLRNEAPESGSGIEVWYPGGHAPG